MKIAGERTAEDWKDLEAALGNSASLELWKMAYDDFFMERIRTRYLWPIELLQKHGDDRGEGFSIVSLQCAMIEFLLKGTLPGIEALRKGAQKRSGEHS